MAYRAALDGYEALACEHPEDDEVQDGLAQTALRPRLLPPRRLRGAGAAVRGLSPSGKKTGEPACVRPPTPSAASRGIPGQGRPTPGRLRERRCVTYALEGAREIAHGLAREFPADPSSRFSLGLTLHELATLHRTVQRPRDALELGQQALPLLRVAFLDTQLNPWYGAELARACADLGAIQTRSGRVPKRRLRSYAEASRVRRRVAQANPAVAATHSELIASEVELSRLYGTMGLRRRGGCRPPPAPHDVIEGLPKDDPGELYVVACVHALNCAKASNLDQGRHDADEAVAALRRDRRRLA